MTVLENRKLKCENPALGGAPGLDTLMPDMHHFSRESHRCHSFEDCVCRGISSTGPATHVLRSATPSMPALSSDL